MNRREMLRLSGYAAAAASTAAMSPAAKAGNGATNLEAARWDDAEIVLEGPESGG